MVPTYFSFFTITVFLTAIAASPTKDLILGRTYVVPDESPETTYNLLRLTSSETSVQQILYAVFTPIQAIINAILTLICSLIAPLTTTVEAVRGAVLVNLISLVTVISSTVAILFPELAVPLQVIQIVLNAGNQLLYNGTIIISEYGCTAILGINDVVTTIVDAIIGVF